MCRTAACGGTKKLPGGYVRYDWAVRNPINNYDVALNVGNYVHFSDVYRGESGPLTLDYWVLPENLEKAKKQFAANVPPMLKSMEAWFGPYPFYQDGYKLIEAPHLGMEHQSAVGLRQQVPERLPGPRPLGHRLGR